MNFPYYKIYDSSERFPPLLKELKNYPKTLYVSGNLLPQDFDGIAVVGARRMTSYGEAVIKSVVGELVAAGITIVSGLAFGVDITAQELALDMGGRTVAVIGSGLNKISPRSNLDVAERITKKGQGALISSFEPDLEGNKKTYPQRDFIMAGLCKAVLVIEAAERSGTSYTVDAALTLGRSVFVVPGSIFSEMSVGCHKYINDGAILTTCAQDIFDVLGVEFAKSAKASLNFENEFDKKVYEALSLEGILLEDLCLQILEPVSRVLQVLTLMEVRGLVIIEGGFVRKMQ